MFGMIPGVAVNLGGLGIVVDVALLPVVLFKVGGAGIFGVYIGEREGLLASTNIGEEGLSGGDCSGCSVFRESRERERCTRGMELSLGSHKTLCRIIVGPSSSVSQPSNSSSLSDSSRSSIMESITLGSEGNVRCLCSAMVARTLLRIVKGKREKAAAVIRRNNAPLPARKGARTSQ